MVIFSAVAKGAVVNATNPGGAPGAITEVVGVPINCRGCPPGANTAGDATIDELLSDSADRSTIPESVKFNIVCSAAAVG